MSIAQTFEIHSRCFSLCAIYKGCCISYVMAHILCKYMMLYMLQMQVVLASTLLMHFCVVRLCVLIHRTFLEYLVFSLKPERNTASPIMIFNVLNNIENHYCNQSISLCAVKFHILVVFTWVTPILHALFMHIRVDSKSECTSFMHSCTDNQQGFLLVSKLYIIGRCTYLPNCRWNRQPFGIKVRCFAR